MKKIAAILFALPCFLFSETSDLAIEGEDMDDSAIEQLFIGMSDDSFSIDELNDEEAKKLFQDGIITMSEEEEVAEKNLN